MNILSHISKWNRVTLDTKRVSRRDSLHENKLKSFSGYGVGGGGGMLWGGRGAERCKSEGVRGGVRILVNVHWETDPDQNKLYYNET